MPDEDPVTDSPLSTAVTSVLHDESDILIFSGNSTKEQLREIALRRLSEMRSERASLLSDKAALQEDKLALQLDKQHQQMQIEDLRHLLAGIQQAREDQAKQQTDSTQAPIAITSVSSKDSVPAVRRTLTKPALPEKFNRVEKTPTIAN